MIVVIPVLNLRLIQSRKSVSSLAIVSREREAEADSRLTSQTSGVMKRREVRDRSEEGLLRVCPSNRTSTSEKRSENMGEMVNEAEKRRK